MFQDNNNEDKAPKLAASLLKDWKDAEGVFQY